MNKIILSLFIISLYAFSINAKTAGEKCIDVCDKIMQACIIEEGYSPKQPMNQLPESVKDKCMKPSDKCFANCFKKHKH